MSKLEHGMLFATATVVPTRVSIHFGFRQARKVHPPRLNPYSVFPAHEGCFPPRNFRGFRERKGVQNLAMRHFHAEEGTMAEPNQLAAGTLV